MKTNLAYATDLIPDTGAADAARTLDPVELDALLRLGAAQAARRARLKHRKPVMLRDNYSADFPMFRVR